MATLQKSVSFSLMGILAASCLLIALAVQEGAAVPLKSHCRLHQADFQQPYITNYTFRLAEEASMADNNTDVRLISMEKLFHGVKMSQRCYVMKQVLNFTIEEVLLPQSDRFQPYMQEVLSFLMKLNNKLSQCHIENYEQHIHRNVQHLKDTVKENKSLMNIYLACLGLKNNNRRFRLAIVTHPKGRGMISSSESDALADSYK